MSTTSIYQYEDIDYQSAIVTTASISLCFSFIVPLTYSLYPTLRQSWHIKLLLCLAISDIVTSIGHIIPNVTVQTCRLQALLLQYGEISSVCWLCCIAYNRVIVLDERIVACKYRWLYNVVSWSIPVIFALINLIDGTFGQTDIQCWIPSTYVGHRLLTFNIPILVLLIFFAVYSLQARRLLHRRAKQFGSQLQQQYEYSGRLIVIHALLLLAIHIPAILHRTAELNINVTNNTVTVVPRSIAILHAVFSPLQGLVNILLFATSRHVQRSIHLVKSIGVLPLISQLKYILQNSDGKLVEPLKGIQLLDTAQYDAALPVIELACPTVAKSKRIKPPKTISEDSTEFQQHSVFVGTWNVGNSMPPNTLKEWLQTDKNYDIYVIGVQECAYKVPGTSIVVYSMSPGGGSNCEQFWFDLVCSTVGSGYSVVAKRSLWHMRLIILCKTTLVTQISSVYVQSEACGLAHILGNKGGICIAFNIGALSYAFINVHLNAHSGNGKRRNTDIVQILSTLYPKQRSLDSYHCIVVFGDMNYRWSGLTTKQVLKCIDTNSIALLQQYDELRCMLHSNSALYGYIDNDVTYMPTYKYLTNKKLAKHKYKVNINELQHDGDVNLETNDLNQAKTLRSSLYTHKRAPAYTDRILYKVRSDVQIDCVESNDISTINTSDHRPIYAVYNIAYDSSVPHKRSKRTQVIGPKQYTAHSRQSSIHRNISIDTSPRHNHIDFIQQCTTTKHLNIVLTGVQVYDVFTPSSLPLLEPYLELHIQHASTMYPTSQPYISNVSLPEYRPYIADSSNQHVLSPVNHDKAELIHKQFSPSKLRQRTITSRRNSSNDDSETMSLQQFTETERLHSNNATDIQQSYQSFLVAEWYDYCVPTLQFTSNTAESIGNEWQWPVNQYTLLRVLLAGQLVIKLRDRFCTGEDELQGTATIELKQCYTGNKIQFTGLFVRDSKYCGYIVGNIQLTGNDKSESS